jgi:uncharacterized protein (UPF0264 family)
MTQAVVAKTKLLVSVRSVAECRRALHPAVDVIDIKEPERGSLGAADTTTLRAIVDWVAGRRSVSAALGELRDAAAIEFSSLPVGLSFAKFGLAGCAMTDWPDAWSAAIRRLPPQTTPVAVAYADWQRAQSPPWPEVLTVGQQLGSQVLLIDTFEKSAGRLFDSLTFDELLEIRQRTRAAAMQLALAGSLQLADIAMLHNIAPDFIAVRSAVCNGRRTGVLYWPAIDQLAAAMRPARISTGNCLSSFPPSKLV